MMKAPKTEKVNEELIRRVTERIVKEYDPDKIILYGSLAWGKSNKDCDLDLFIIKDSPLRRDLRSTEISKLFFPRRFGLDVLVYTPEEIERRLKLGDFFVKRIIEHGVVLYDRKTSDTGWGMDLQGQQ